MGCPFFLKEVIVYVMKKNILFFILVVNSISLLSSNVSLDYHVTLSNRNSSRDISVGVNENATEGLDTDLGETDRPKNLPSGSWTVALEFENAGEYIWSLKDYRPNHSDSEKYMVQYHLKTLFDRGDTMFFDLTSNAQYVDSIVLTDTNSTKYYRFKVPDISNFEIIRTLDNNFDDYYMEVYYNFSPGSVEESTDVLFAYPSPAKEFLNIEGVFSSYKIIDNNGRIIVEDRLIGNQINIESLATGTYFLILDDKKSTKFIKE